MRSTASTESTTRSGAAYKRSEARNTAHDSIKKAVKTSAGVKVADAKPQSESWGTWFRFLGSKAPVSNDWPPLRQGLCFWVYDPTNGITVNPVYCEATGCGEDGSEFIADHSLAGGQCLSDADFDQMCTSRMTSDLPHTGPNGTLIGSALCPDLTNAANCTEPPTTQAPVTTATATATAIAPTSSINGTSSGLNVGAVAGGVAGGLGGIAGLGACGAFWGKKAYNYLTAPTVRAPRQVVFDNPAAALAQNQMRTDAEYGVAL